MWGGQGGGDFLQLAKPLQGIIEVALPGCQSGSTRTTQQQATSAPERHVQGLSAIGGLMHLQCFSIVALHEFLKKKEVARSECTKERMTGL